MLRLPSLSLSTAAKLSPGPGPRPCSFLFPTCLKPKLLALAGQSDPPDLSSKTSLLRLPWLEQSCTYALGLSTFTLHTKTHCACVHPLLLDHFARMDSSRFCTLFLFSICRPEVCLIFQFSNI